MRYKYCVREKKFIISVNNFMDLFRQVLVNQKHICVSADEILITQCNEMRTWFISVLVVHKYYS